MASTKINAGGMRLSFLACIGRKARFLNGTVDAAGL
jgi:hypothetical protein